MPFYDFKCMDCQHGWEELVPVGEMPECPECSSSDGPAKVWLPSRRAVVSDEIPGGMVVENLGHDPVVVYSHSERLRIAKDRGLEEKVRHIDGSPYTSNWDTITQESLDRARQLLERHARVGHNPNREGVEDGRSLIDASIRTHNPDAVPARMEGGVLIDPSGEVSR